MYHFIHIIGFHEKERRFGFEVKKALYRNFGDLESIKHYPITRERGCVWRDQEHERRVYEEVFRENSPIPENCAFLDDHCTYYDRTSSGNNFQNGYPQRLISSETSDMPPWLNNINLPYARLDGSSGNLIIRRRNVNISYLTLETFLPCSQYDHEYFYYLSADLTANLIKKMLDEKIEYEARTHKTMPSQ